MKVLQVNKVLAWHSFLSADSEVYLRKKFIFPLDTFYQVNFHALKYLFRNEHDF